MPADFIKKYPWVRPAFRDAKREWTEMKEAEAGFREMVKQAEAPSSLVLKQLKAPLFVADGKLGEKL